MADEGLAAEALAAYRRGEDSLLADVGARIEARLYLSLLAFLRPKQT